MSQSSPVSSVNNALFLMRVITGAMIGGVLAFGLVVLIVKKDVQAAEPVISYAALLMAVTCMGARLVVPDLIARSQVAAFGQVGSAEDEATRTRMVGVFQSRQIVGLALCEGPAFFNLIAWWLEGQALSIATVGFLILVMITSLPTRRRLDDWIARRIEEMRMDSPE